MLKRLIERVRESITGKPSTDSTVAFYSMHVSLASAACAEAAIGTGERVRPEQRYAVTAEFVIALLHLIDRILFAKGQNRRDLTMDGLCAITYARLVETYPTDQGFDHQMTSLAGEYSEVTRLYGGSKKLFPEGDESPKGTLMWEFGKRFATACEHEMDLAYVAVGEKLLLSAFSEIQSAAKKHAML